MTLDEAIERCNEVNLRKRNECTVNGCDVEITKSCIECAEEHRQLAEWLTELKDRRSAVERLEKQKKTLLHCENGFEAGAKWAFDVAIEIVKKGGTDNE